MDLSLSFAQYSGLAIALLGSVWAVHRANCNECNNIPTIFGYSLAPLGVAFYSLALFGRYKNLNLVPPAIKAAAYLHGVLIVHMIITRKLCPACFLTAIGAITAAQQSQ